MGSGWHGWDRTSDRRINSALLYRLSYMPMCSFNYWSGWLDLNQRPPASKAGRLPD